MTTAEVQEGAIRTYTGLLIRPLDPDPDLIVIEDIAHHLSNICRFTGAVREFYPVGQHSVLASLIVPQEDAFEALMHDSSEAYFSDFASPLKQTPGFGDAYREIEDRLMEVISMKFGFPYPKSPYVELADKCLLRTEQRDLMPPNSERKPGACLDFVIEPWAPAEAEMRFLDRFEEVK